MFKITWRKYNVWHCHEALWPYCVTLLGLWKYTLTLSRSIMNIIIIQCIRKVFRPLDFFHILLSYSLILKWIRKKETSVIYSTHNNPIMTKRKQVYRIFCEVTKSNKQKHLIYVSVQTICYETRNWAQVHPVSIDHPWDVSTTWLVSTCGTFNWLDMIWKGTHLYI